METDELTASPLQNFVLNIYAAQMAARFENPEEYLNEKRALDELDSLFLIVFSIELGINAYANWFLPFVRNPWSIFDCIVVGLSLIGLAPTGLPLSLVLLLRCCRVLRVFGRFRAVSSIFSALVASAVPLASTFFIIFVFASICEQPPFCLAAPLASTFATILILPASLPHNVCPCQHA
jgi:hypothetical protein